MDSQHFCIRSLTQLPHFSEGSVINREIKSRHYQIGETIRFSSSSSRVVCLATSKLTGEKVVLKVVNLNEDHGYLIELRLPTRLDIPYTIRPIDHFISSPFGCLVFPHVKSRPCRPQSWQTWLRVLHSLFESLTSLHSNHYAHLDIKPSNILLHRVKSRVKEVYLIDFGLSEFISPESSIDSDSENKSLSIDGYFEDSALSIDGSCFSGTFPFIDPMYMRTGVPSVQSDMWSIGVMVAQSMATKPTMFFKYSSSFSDQYKQAVTFPSRFQSWVEKEKGMKERLRNSVLLHLVRNVLKLNPDERWTSSCALTYADQEMQKYNIRPLVKKI